MNIKPFLNRHVENIALYINISLNSQECSEVQNIGDVNDFLKMIDQKIKIFEHWEGGYPPPSWSEHPCKYSSIQIDI
jgi:hypothetical protein